MVGRKTVLDQKLRIDSSYDDIRSVLHELSCDYDPAVQKWIQRSGNPRILVSDIAELAQTAVMNINTKSCCMRANSKIALCGWSCVDAWPGFLIPKVPKA